MIKNLRINTRINILDLKTSKKISFKKFKEDNTKEINQK